MPGDTPERPRLVLFEYVILGFVVLLVFLPTITHDFVRWDDTHNLAGNPDMLPPTVRGTLKYWRGPYKDLYVPVTYTLWALAAKVAYVPSSEGGTLVPGVFHGLSVLLHACAACGVLALLSRLIANRWSALAGAILFAIHPVQVESVAWVSGMKDVLAGMLAVWAIYCYVVFVQSQAGARWGVIAWGTGLFILAMLSKPSAVVVPLLAGAVHFLRLAPRAPRGAGSGRAAWLIFWVLLAVPIIYLGKKFQPTPEHLFVPPLYARPLVVLDSIAFYLAKVVMPLRLAIDYGRSPAWLWGSAQRYWTWIIPAALVAAAFCIRKRFPALLLGVALLVLGALPVAGLVPFDFQAYSTVSDHYLYLAMLGPALLLAVVSTPRGVPSVKRINVRLMIGGLILLSLATKSVNQVFVWRDSQSLFAHAVAVNPRSAAGNVNLGNLYSDAGRARGDRALLEQAIARYRAALETNPDDPVISFNLGNQYTMLERWPEAVGAYEKAVARASDRAGYHAALGWAYARSGDRAKALQAYSRALQIDPNEPLAREGIATLRQ